MWEDFVDGGSAGGAKMGGEKRLTKVDMDAKRRQKDEVHVVISRKANAIPN
jgi:hypothetical protein